MGSYTYVREQGQYTSIVDFGDSVFQPVEIIFTREKNGTITVVSSKIIGHPEDFDSAEKMKKYLDKPFEINSKIMEKGNEVKVISADAPEAYKGKKGVVCQIGMDAAKCEMCEVKFEGMPDKVWVPSTALEFISEGSPEGIFNSQDEVEDRLVRIFSEMDKIYESMDSLEVLGDLDFFEEPDFQNLRNKLNEAFGINYAANIDEYTPLGELVDNVCDLLGIDYTITDDE